jgi:hypothetical protein
MANSVTLSSMATAARPVGGRRKLEDDMRKITGKMTNIIAAATMAASLSAMVGLARPASGQDAGSQAAYRDIEQTLGTVPTFFKLFPESGIAGA